MRKEDLFVSTQSLLFRALFIYLFIFFYNPFNVLNRFKQIDNKYIRPCLIREHVAHEPKILETYSKLAMKDAMDQMRRTGSTLTGGQNSESMGVLFRNYTANNLNNRYALPLLFIDVAFVEL